MQYNYKKSKVHRIQKRLLDEFECDLDIDDTFKLFMLRKEFFKSERVLEKYKGRGNKSYNGYIEACDKVMAKAEKLGLIISTPVERTTDIKTKIVTLLGIGGLTDTIKINNTLIAMKIIVDTNIGKTKNNLSNNTNLPVGEKERLRLLKEALLRKELISIGVEDDNCLNKYYDLNIFDDDTSEIENQYEEDSFSFKKAFEKIEQDKIDFYNSQL